MNHTITVHEADQRLDRFCRKYFKNHSEIKLGDIYSWIRKGAIKVNGRKRPEKYRLNEWDQVTWNDEAQTQRVATDFTATKEQKLASYALSRIEQYILYQDENRLVFNKPAWVVVHPWNKHDNDITMHDMLQIWHKHNSSQDKQDSPTFKPAFCYRLDKDTSGIHIAWITYQAVQHLNDLIKTRQVDKTYTTVLIWSLTKTKEATFPLEVWFDKKFGKSKSFHSPREGKESYSLFEPIMTKNLPWVWPCTLTRVTIKTWRMHQIRVHWALIWHPVLGDLMYWSPAVNRIATKSLAITRQLLHSTVYAFQDIDWTRRKFTAPLPEQFTTLFPSS